MIHRRLTSKAQTTIPRPVRQALGVGPGDTLDYAIEEGRVVLTARQTESGDIAFAQRLRTSFPEWFDELDAEFDER